MGRSLLERLLRKTINSQFKPWNQKTALFADGPVVKVLEPARDAITKALSAKSPL
jgi:hypothetical protein